MKSEKSQLHGSMLRTVLSLAITAGVAMPVMAVEQYPFAGMPTTLEATMNVQKWKPATQFNNDLLGTNIFGFTTADEVAFLNAMNPSTIRFPHGLWANWHDWRTDSIRVFGSDTWRIEFIDSIKAFERNGKKIGIEGLTKLNSTRKSSLGQGYDMLWTFNMSADGTDFTKSPDSLARYKDLVQRGLEVKDIELGNENFYKGQRSSIIPTAVEYILRAKSISSTLKKEDPSIQVSVPLSRKPDSGKPTWNAQLTKDMNYFDAVTIHQYIGKDPDDATMSNEAYGEALKARQVLEDTMNTYVMPYITKDGKLLKPIWLSEWGVYSGGANAASALGMADVYLYMSEHQDIYTRANWFSVNGKLNSFVVLNDKRQPAKPYQKTLFGSTHEIMRSVFEDAQLLESTMSTAKLTGTTVNAVNARAVVKDGKTMVVAVNLTNKPAQFTLKFNGAIYRGAYVHDAMTFKTMDEERILGFDENPLNFNMRSTGSITLPAYSVNKLSGFVASAATSTPTPIATATSKPTATSTPKPVATATSKPTATSTPKPVATATPTATSTPKPTATLAPTATPVANNECSAIQNVAWDARTEIDIAAGNCVQFDRDLKGKTVQFWDSDVNTSCDFRGFARSIDGTGAVAIDSNYLATTALSGKTLKLLRANDNTCKYIKLRAY